MKFVFLFSFFFAACAVKQTTTTTSNDLDIAIREASSYLNENIPKGNKIAILNMQSDYAALSDYIIDELIANAVNDKVFSVVDRTQLEQIRTELKFQISGAVDDKAALEIGKFLEAQTIVLGAISEIGDIHRIRIRALDVQTAQVQGQYNRNVNNNRLITALSKSGKTQTPSNETAIATTVTTVNENTSTAATPTAPVAPAAPTYKIGDAGPAGGIIFYDKGNNTGGWRYLEAAPADINKLLKGSTEDFEVNNIKERGVGWGKRNTAAIMKEAQNKGGGFGWAAQACDAYTLNGFDDWFLPSRDELHYLYGHLHMQSLGTFRNEWYWSSTAASSDYWMAENFSDGRQDNYAGRNDFRVRPIRQF
jgi:hypothetical protein